MKTYSNRLENYCKIIKKIIINKNNKIKKKKQ